ncbi:unnamed protein product [Effrenium voratum]|uniref:Polyketide synthase n=1 Tax=Effrenium voratum TaxID=2562239 RepID=A0AA36MSD9_9DINO|nr:unnamed protein product [Effrenium voratum]
MQLFRLCGKRQRLAPDAGPQEDLAAQDPATRLRTGGGSELLQVVRRVAAELGVPYEGDALSLDSAAAVRFAAALETQLGWRLPATLLFDYPSISELVDRGLQPRDGTSSFVHVSACEGGPGVLISACWELPGASNEVLWSRLENQVDEVREIPLCRWDWTETNTSESLGYRHASFLEGAEQFDARFFGLTAAETQAADPQQRLLLSTSYRALAASGHDKGTLLGTPVAVFAGISNQDGGTTRPLHKLQVLTPARALPQRWLRTASPSPWASGGPALPQTPPAPLRSVPFRQRRIGCADRRGMEAGVSESQLQPAASCCWGLTQC